MPLPPDYSCNPCAPYWLRETLYWPPADGAPPVACCLLQEADATSLLLEDGSGCIQPENC